MPTPKQGETKTGFLERCIPIVIADRSVLGNDAAVAMCTTLWEDGNRANSMTTNTRKVAMITILAVPDASAIRTAQLGGQEHTVIPVVMLKEGVLHPGNADSPELALAEEFGRFPASWDGRPVVYDHPRFNGVPIPANSPDVLDNAGVGQLFNTRLEDKTLHSEIWINNTKLKNLSQEIQDHIEKLKKGDTVMEVSTGLFCMLEESPGQFNGKPFTTIWRDVVPDHLAVLPDGVIGACSVEGGCGTPRLNSTHPDYASTHTVIKGMNLPANASLNAPGTFGFSLSDMLAKYPTLSAPIHSLVSCAEYKVDPTKQADYIKALDILKVQCECQKPKAADANSRENPEPRSLFRAMKTFFKDALTFKFLGNAALSHDDIWDAVCAGIGESVDYFWIVAIFNTGENKGSVVYEDYMNYGLYAVDFRIGPDGKITISGPPVQVRPETQFVPVQVASKNMPDPSQPSTGGMVDSSQGQQPPSSQSQLTPEVPVNIKELVGKLVASKKFEASDEPELLKLNEATLTKMLAVAEAPAPAPVAPAPVAAAKPTTVEGYIAEAPAELQVVLAAGVAMHRKHKDELIAHITANASNKFTKEALTAKSADELENLVALMGPAPGSVDYRANGMPMLPVALDDGDFTPVPADPWAKPATENQTH